MPPLPRCARPVIVTLMIALMVALAALTASGSRAEGAWQTVSGSEMNFTVELPAAPNHSTRELHTGAGAAYTMHQYVVHRRDLAYVVWSATYPDEVNVATPRANLQGGLDNAAKGMEGGTWASIDWLTHQGHVAVDAVGVRSGKAIRSFLVLKGRQIVSLTYAGPIGSSQSADAVRFIGSLKLDPAP
jgi:hypothetical protein